jgi:type I restriction enzyme S subunit
MGLCSADMYPLTPVDGFDPKYLHNLFLSEVFTRQAVAEQDRTGIPKVNRQQLNRIVIPMAPLPEQRAIGERLALIAQRAGIAIRSRDALKSVFSSMLHLLMAGQVRISI